MKIAVIGGGIAGMTAAYLLGRVHDVVLFEKESKLGGHSNTVTIDEDGESIPVDTGFIVCNPENYPLFYRLLRAWKVLLRDAEMSFGFSSDRRGLAYVGPSPRFFLRTPANLFNFRFLSMLFEQRRFNRRARFDLDRNTIGDRQLGDYLKEVGISPFFVETYIRPLISAIWSTPGMNVSDFPAESFVRFFDNHGMLDFSKLPQWQTILGGSHAYVKAFQSAFRGEIRTSSPVLEIIRGAEVTVRAADDARVFDRVVLATHADTSLSMLKDPSDQEASLLGAWRYLKNHTVLHTDTSLLPSRRSLWASWNYRERSDGISDEAPSVTYYMNKLQGLRARRDYFVTLNQGGDIRPECILYETYYTHPQYTVDAVHTQGKLRDLNGERGTFYCGSYHRYGFHEDAVSSAVEAASHMGCDLP